MRLSMLARTAKRLVDQRGGVDALKEDAEKLKTIAKSDASLGTKAGAAVRAIKEAAAPDAPQAGAREAPDQATAAGTAPESAPAEPAS